MISPVSTATNRIFFVFFVIVLLFPIHQSYGQTFKVYYNTSWTYDNDDGGSRLLQTIDGNFFLGGSASNNTWLVRTDNVGNVVWDRYFSSRRVQTLIEEENGSILVLTLTGSYKLILMKLSSSGTVLWAKQYEWDDDHDLMDAKMVKASDGGYFIAVGISEGYMRTGLMRINSVGDIIWNKRIAKNAPYHIRPSELILTSDNHLMVLARYYDDFSTPLTYHAYLIKMTETGSIIWVRELDEASCYSLVETSTGDYMVGCSGLNIVKLNEAGTVLFSNTYSAIYPAGGTSQKFLRLSNNTYLQLQSKSMFAIDENGNLQWEGRYFPSNDHSNLYDVIETRNGNIAVIGTSDNDDDDMLFMHLNSQGGFDDPCSYYVADSVNDPTSYTASVTTTTLSFSTSGITASTISMTPGTISDDSVRLCESLNTFDVVCNPTEIFADRGGCALSECIVTSYEWAGTVSMSCQDLMAGAVYNFSDDTITLGMYESATTLLDVTTPSDSVIQSDDFYVVGTSGGLSDDDHLYLTISTLDAIPNPVQFSDLEVGQQQVMGVTITNIGPSLVEIDAVSSPKSPFAIQNNDCLYSVLDTNDSCTLDVIFAPTQMGAYNETFEIFTSAADSIMICLESIALAPDITLHLVTPNGGESWDYSPNPLNRKNHLIFWESDYFFDLSRIRLSYRVDDSTEWTYIADSKYTNYRSSSAVAIPDNDLNGAVSEITVADSFEIEDLNVTVNIAHTRVDDLTIQLISPAKATITLSDGDFGHGGGINYTGTIFDDESYQTIDSGSAPYTGFFVPDNALSSLDTGNTAGIWTLKVIDDAANEVGSLLSWSINFSDWHNSNISGTSTLIPESTSFLWDMPTKDEAANQGQKLPTFLGQVRVEAWGEGTTEAFDISDSVFYIIDPTTSAIRTLILWSPERLCQYHEPDGNCDCSDWRADPDCTEISPLHEKLVRLANHEQVTGVILDLGLVPSILTAYDCWDTCYDGGCQTTTPCDVFSVDPHERANEVAEEIRTYLMNLVTDTYTNVSTVILVGDDKQIPFYRMTDGAVIYPESNYPLEGSLDTSNTVGSALAANYFFSDNFYSELAPTTSGLEPPHDIVYLNDLAIGRMVETPDQIIGVIDPFLAHNGQINLADPGESVLIAGCEFFHDSARDIKNAFFEGSKNTDCLIDDPDRADNQTDCFVEPPTLETDFFYDRDDLLNELFPGYAHLLNNINCHANHYTLVASTAPTELTTTMINDNIGNLEGSFHYAPGCHTGLPVPEKAVPDATTLDLPEVMARKRALAYIGNTGYGWGLRSGKGLSERLMEKITEEVLENNSITAGEALANAKRSYFLSEKRYDVFDEKVLHELTLFGIPNTLIINTADKTEAKEREALPLPDGLDKACAEGICLEKKLLRANTTKDLPPGMTELQLNFAFGSETYRRHITKDGDYFTLNNEASSEVGDTLQPRFIYNSTLSGTTAHGVIFLGGAYNEEETFEAVVAVPESTRYSNIESEGPKRATFTPALAVDFGYSGAMKSTRRDSGSTSMIVHTGYFDDDTSIEYTFDTMQFAIYYSELSDFTPPIIDDPGVNGFHTISELTAYFSVSTRDTDHDIFRVVVTYNDLRTGHGWNSIDLVYNPDSETATGSLQLMGDLYYYVLVVDAAGNVAIWSETGLDKDYNNQEYGSTWKAPYIYSIAVDDADSDELPDLWEDKYDCLSSTLDDTDSDTVLDPDDDHDFDGLTNKEEFNLDLNPCLADTDGGGDNDGSELENGRDPKNKYDDLKISIIVNESGGHPLIEWPDGTLPVSPCLTEVNRDYNNVIDGSYWIYRSSDPFFSPDEQLVPDPGIPTEEPLVDGTTCYHDTTTSTGLYFYKVWNCPLNSESPTISFLNPVTYDPEAPEVTIVGRYFAEGATVLFGGKAATDIVVVNDRIIECTAPEPPIDDCSVYPCSCEIIITNLNGQYGSLDGAFTYETGAKIIHIPN